MAEWNCHWSYLSHECHALWSFHTVGAGVRGVSVVCWHAEGGIAGQMDSLHSIPSYVKHARTAEGTQGKRAASERSQVGTEQGGSQSSVRICEESHQYAGTLLPYICGLFFEGGLVYMEWDDWWSKPSSLQRTIMFGQICFFHKYSGAPRFWVVRTMNTTPMPRTKGNVFMTDSYPV